MLSRSLFLTGLLPAALLLSCSAQLKGGPDDGGQRDNLAADAPATDATQDSSGVTDSSSQDTSGQMDSTLPADSSTSQDTHPAPDTVGPQPDLPPAKDQGPLSATSVIFLHHSTGECIWNGGIPQRLEDYNSAHSTSYSITEQAFPKSSPYGWENYPYDYWNIWVNNAGSQPYMTEPTLEILTQQYNVIVFKHCFHVSAIQPDTGSGDVSSSERRIENYKLQYNALKQKLHSFPNTRFVLWTGAALTAGSSTPEQGTRSREFFSWVKESWDEPGDNIFIWDFFELETEGGNFILDSYASSSGDSHPNSSFSSTVAPLFVNRLVDVIEGRGDSGSLTGQ